MSNSSKQLHLVAPLGDHLDVEIARVARRRADGVGHVELDLGALARELAQAAQCQLDVARADLDGVVEVLVLALVPHLDRTALAVLVLADAHAFRVETVGAERRGAGRADPLAAALVALLLLLETLLQRLHQLLPAAHRLDLGLLLVGQKLLGELAQPFFGNFRGDALGGQRFQSLEDMAEHAVELVEVALVLHQHRARQVVEVVDLVVGDALLHGLHQRQVLLDGDRHLGLTQFEEEVGEHRVLRGSMTTGAAPGGP